MARRRSNPAIAHSIGARIRAVREAAGISQQALADRVGATAPTISRLEAGSLMPTVTTVVALAAAMGVPASALFQFEPAEQAAPADVEEATLLAQFRRLPPRYKAVVRGFVAAILNVEG